MNGLARYFHNIFDGISTTLTGMRVTMHYLRSPHTTLQYPKERMPMFERFRGLLHNRIDDCTGCSACSRACPIDCFSIVTMKAGKDEDLGLTRDGTQKKLHVYEYKIDTLKCLWCGFCVEVCPTSCLTMSSEYEVSGHDRASWYLSFAAEQPPPDFDMDGMRLKQNRVTNPVDYAGEADPRHLELPAGETRPQTGAGVYDFSQHRAAEVAKMAAAAKAAAAAAKQAAAEQQPPAEDQPPATEADGGARG